MLTKLDLIRFLRIGQAIEYPPWGEEKKPEVV
jgi:hypothetical protein